MKAMEIAQLLRSGVLLTVNSDAPAYFGGYAVDNYWPRTLSPSRGLTTTGRASYLDKVGRFVDQFGG